MAGDFWTRFSYDWQGKTWRDLTSIEENDREFLLPEWKSGTFQLGFTGDSGWSAALIARNVFDDAGTTWMSASSYGDFFGDPRWHHVRGLQRPRNISLSFTKKW